MKKLIVLMIVLFPVTAWAGAHDIQKPRRVLCDELYQSAPKKLNEIAFNTHRYNQKDDVILKDFYKRRINNLRQKLAHEAVIYTAFCK